MSAPALRRSGLVGVGRRWATARLVPGRRAPAASRVIPPLDPRLQVARATLMMLGAIACGLLLQLLVVSPLQQRAAQQRAYDSFRGQLAAGTAPVVASDLTTSPGTPIAYLEVPSIGLRQVVVEGTSGATLYTGPGHRRDTPLPGYAGTSVVMGRRTTFGGPFAELGDLRAGDLIQVTVGAGVAEYEVAGVRRAGDPAPAPPEAGSGRLVLATADGSALLPSGALLVDADLVGDPLGAVRPAVAPGALPRSERAMGIDGSSLWRLLLWLQALVVAVIAAVWCWFRWHRAKTWIAFSPLLLLVGLMTAAEAFVLLPNLV